MTDIVEQLRNHHKDIGLPDSVESWLTSAADEIERLRKENQELKLQYLSDQGQWIEETGRLRAALQEISTRNFPEGTATLELRKIARAALGEKE